MKKPKINECASPSGTDTTTIQSVSSGYAGSSNQSKIGCEDALQESCRHSDYSVKLGAVGYIYMCVYVCLCSSFEKGYFSAIHE